MTAWILLLAPTLIAQSAILEQALSNEVNQLREREKYFYREHAEHRRPGGKLNFTKDYEWIFLEGEPFRRMVSRNGKPLKGKHAREEAERLRMTAAERRAANGKPNPRIISFGNLSDGVILTEMDHIESGEETIEGRKTWVIRAEPKPGRESIAYRLTFWIDQEDYVVAQLKYEVIGKGVDTLPGSWLTTRYVRYAGGLWFKQTFRSELFTGPPRPRSHWVQNHTFRDFKKFDAESTVTFQER